MSFSVEFIAKSKSQAQSAVEQQHMPDTVRKFLTIAIENLPAADEDKPRFIKVKAQGHLCEGPNSWNASSAQIEVSEIRPTW